MAMQALDAAQIRAGISLLGLSNEAIASACGVTAQSISNIKRGTTRPQPRVLSAIKRVLEYQGVEFLDNSGVRLKSSEVEVYEGPDRFDDYSNFLYEHLARYGGDVCVSVVDDSLFAKYRKDHALHVKRMQSLVDRGDVTFRILATKRSYVASYAQYRWQAKQSAAPTAFYAFGDCLALMTFEHTKAPYVILSKSGPLTEAYRYSFEIAWNKAKDGPFPKE